MTRLCRSTTPWALTHLLLQVAACADFLFVGTNHRFLDGVYACMAWLMNRMIQRDKDGGKDETRLHLGFGRSPSLCAAASARHGDAPLRHRRQQCHPLCPEFWTWSNIAGGDIIVVVVPQPLDRIPHAPLGVRARPRLSAVFNHTHEYDARSCLQASNNRWQQGRVRQHDPTCDRRGVHLPCACGPRLA
jgi:hypothetical protein